MSEIKWKTSKKTGGEKVNAPAFLEKNEQAEVVFEPKQKMYIESFKTCPGLGRIAVMDSNNLVMLGKVTECEYE